MKRLALIAAATLAAGVLDAAAPSPNDTAAAAIKALAAQPNYSWNATVDSTGGFRPGPTTGKTEKDGYTSVTMTMRDSPLQIILQGDKMVVKSPFATGWQTVAELTAAADNNADGPPNMGRFFARMVQNAKATPTVQATNLLAGAANLTTASDGSIGGNLTVAAVTGMLSFGPPPGGGPAPTIANPNGSVKVWVTNGVLSKYQYNLQGGIDFNGNSFDINRTTTVVISDVGATKVEVPDEAKQKINAPAPSPAAPTSTPASPAPAAGS
jgi:hypothetical protein